ncbi:hypothetical protein AB0K68_24470 [Streptomyces sp. NPDC050698]
MGHIDTTTMVGGAARIGRRLSRLGEIGFLEVVYTPRGSHVRRELGAFAGVL